MEIFTAAEAAKILGLSKESMRAYATRYGVGTKHGRDWLFTKEDIEAIRSRRGKFGRPKTEE